MGGMITAIADSFYINYGDIKPAAGEILFDVKGLVKSHCLFTPDPPMIWRYVSHHEAYMRLPRQVPFP